MQTKDLMIIATTFASFVLAIDAICLVNKQYKKKSITIQERNQYLRTVLLVPLLGALITYKNLKD